MAHLRSFTTIFTLWTLVLGARFTPPECVGDIKEFPNCQKADDIAIKCSDLSKQETIDCFCTQELLNAYVGCKAEFRQCRLGNDYDSDQDKLIADWQDACAPYLPEGITTPIAPAATRTLDAGLCPALAESCAQRSQSATSCSSEHTEAAALTSCLCQDSIVSLASACEIDGRQSCLGATITRDNIFEFRVCEGEMTDSPASTEAGRTTGPSAASTAEVTEGPATADGSIQSTLSFGADATATTTTDSGGTVSVERRMNILSMIGALLYVLLG